jgi:sRNA-binding carbon storage regulator CsrA
MLVLGRRANTRIICSNVDGEQLAIIIIKVMPSKVVLAIDEEIYELPIDGCVNFVHPAWKFKVWVRDIVGKTARIGVDADKSIRIYREDSVITRELFDKYKAECPEDVSLYTYIASQEYNVPLDKVTGPMRSRVKTDCFCYMYSNAGLKNQETMK